MSKDNHFEIDTNDDYEMLCIKLNGEVVFDGNYWDFGWHILPNILSKVASVTEGEYPYE